ncbi:ubiquinone/menaquinone biosynthesis C-methylase UbiE [Bacillus tianshenii]|uniref:Ubiquinone/menaquinone biosynthesis C-methylase UbiE n=1 Tax=Sutcliffiella tianshenii TaxID=1463404 RepID=A0ABS2P2H1_9BACI|nr:class I SAM-dependent methyltransferase [Bacillus tianshenii]MBM7621084.1 ubiquinone/menaquinone biosynthesis C-methylase UbiE [Bacillus tianshenii]
MNNPWNKVIYKIWAPVYDKFFNSGSFLQARKEIFQELPFEKCQKILFVGVGTGADLELIPHANLDIKAIDFSPDMLEKAKSKFKNSRIEFLEMDAQNMIFPSHSFDYVVASLILSVVPDAEKCFQEMERVLKQNGSLIVFDKFAPKQRKLAFGKRVIRPFVQLLGTDIGLSFEKLYKKYSRSLKIVDDKPMMMNGMYRKILMKKEV